MPCFSAQWHGLAGGDTCKVVVGCSSASTASCNPRLRPQPGRSPAVAIRKVWARGAALRPAGHECHCLLQPAEACLHGDDRRHVGVAFFAPRLQTATRLGRVLRPAEPRHAPLCRGPTPSRATRRAGLGGAVLKDSHNNNSRKVATIRLCPDHKHLKSGRKALGQTGNKTRASPAEKFGSAPTTQNNNSWGWRGRRPRRRPRPRPASAPTPAPVRQTVAAHHSARPAKPLRPPEKGAATSNANFIKKGETARGKKKSKALKRKM